ncbi:MAG: hypothetical protein COB53_10330 [Elusimicrobia bacterium]|nr:MAG: hypothetical protein COB53_10330 [Elusimicrobiota bacterium]
MKRLYTIALLLAFSSPFWDLAHPLWEVDDARYAEVPREMVDGGDWVTPQLNYVDYIEKPPLIYWAGALSYSLFGVSEGSARLPLAIFALIGLLGVWWLGNWLYGGRTGTHAVLILASCVQFFALSHVITPDMAVSVALLWSTGLILRCLRKPADAYWAGPAAWIAMAAALLAKGLIGIVLPGVWTVALLILFPETRRGLKKLLFNWGTLVFFVVIGGWFAVMEKANPGFFNVFVIEQHFQRFLTPKYNRPGGWWYYLAVDSVGFLPWTPLAIMSVLVPLLRLRKADSRDLQLALWVVVIFGFFSVSSSKLITYLLPLFPHQAVLAAAFAGRLRRERTLDRRMRAAALALGSLFATAAVLTPFIVRIVAIPIPISTPLIVSAILLLASLAFGLIWFARASRLEDESNLLVPTALAGFLVCACLISGTRCLTDELSVKRLAMRLNERIMEVPADTETRLMAYDRYLHGIPFYTNRPVDVINWVGEMHYAQRFPRYAHRFGDDNTIRQLPTKGVRTFVTLRRRELPQFLDLNPPSEIRSLEPFGPWILAEF